MPALVLTAPGFHSTIVAPGYNMYFLNYLAGNLYDDQRATALEFSRTRRSALAAS